MFNQHHVLKRSERSNLVHEIIRWSVLSYLEYNFSFITILFLAYTYEHISEKQTVA
jgi:hypothetical protein